MGSYSLPLLLLLSAALNSLCSLSLWSISDQTRLSLSFLITPSHVTWASFISTSESILDEDVFHFPAQRSLLFSKFSFLSKKLFLPFGTWDKWDKPNHAWGI